MTLGNPLGRFGLFTERSSLRPASYGIDFYGDSLFTSAALAQGRSDLVQRFVAASLKGWEYALSHPDEIAGRIATSLERVFAVKDPLAFNLFQAEQVQRLTLHPVIQLGHLNPARWRRMHENLKTAGLVKGNFSAQDLIFDPQGEARRRATSIRQMAMWSVGGLIIMAMLLAVWTLALRRRVSLATAALSESESRFRALVDSAPAAIYLTDKGGRFRFINAMFEERVGVQAKDIVGQLASATDILPADILRGYLEQNEAVLQSGAVVTREHEWRTADGLDSSNLVTKFPVADGDGKITAVGTISLDITERKQAERALRESERRIQLIADGLSAMIVYFDAEMRYHYVNSTYNEWYGRDPEAVIGQRAIEIAGPESYAVWGPYAEKALAGEEISVDFELPGTATGSKWVHATYVPHRDDHGLVRGVYALVIDQTDRHQVEQTLRQREAELNAIFDHAPIVVTLKDRHGRMLRANQRMCDNLGRSEAEILGMTSYELFPADVAERIIESERRVLAEGAPVQEIITVPTVAGEREFLQVKFPVALGSGDAIGIGLVATDITERRAAERDRAETEQRLSRILQMTPDAIIVIGTDQHIQVFNRGAERVFGYAAEEVIGRSFETLIPEPLRTVHRRHVTDFVADSVDAKYMSERSEISGLRKSGEVFPALASISKLRLKGDLVYTVMLHDATERKRAEQEVIRAKEAAEIADRAKSEFLANMSHELRTPLNAILGFAQMIQAQTIGPDQGERYIQYAKDIYVSGSFLLAIINDILDLSKIEAGKVTLDERDLDIAEIVESAVRLVRARAGDGELGLTVDVFVEPAGKRLRADERIVRQMLLNLLSNAIKFTPAGGSVQLSARCREDGGMAFCVDDSGIGMTPEDITVALSSFGQVEGVLTRSAEGTGLGLPLVASLAELHDGSLELESQPGQGTRATINFPDYRLVEPATKN
ncbi:MAG: hypothetical protein CMM08_01885 [Rhodospirillaceae bacterium]|nr:hypothetical protein [Rhodospirillaceae bacterium]